MFNLTNEVKEVKIVGEAYRIIGNKKYNGSIKQFPRELEFVK